MATENVEAWSTTAATNATADAGINWAEGQDPATVNNSARGMMAAIAKQSDDQGGNLAAGGSANALTVTTNQVLGSGQLTGGLRLLLRATADNTSTTVTFAPDGLTAANIKRADGSALAVGSIKSGMYLDLVYNSGSSEWRCANIAPVPVGGSLGSGLASFSATLSGNQTGVPNSTPTLITFNTAGYNVGSYFNTGTNRWVPPAGTCALSAGFNISGTFQALNQSISIYKNGAALNKVISNFGSSTQGTPIISTQDQCNGTDYYQVYTEAGIFSGTGTITAGTQTWFKGSMI